MKEKRIVLLARDGDTSHLVYHELKKSFNIIGVFVDTKISRRKFLKRRIAKIGLWKVTGQLLYQLFIHPFVKSTSKVRIQEIILDNHFNLTPFDAKDIVYTGSVNSAEAIFLLKSLHPDLVVINGTRILSEDLLNSIPAGFINIHTGITPLYRGVHGGYWALVKNDLQHAGVTIHYVDKGIDTGNIIAQQNFNTTVHDNITTYPYLQYAAAVPLLKKAIKAHLSGKRITIPAPTGRSQLYYHPTFISYLYNRLIHHIK